MAPRQFLWKKQRERSFYSIRMMKTAFMFFGRVSADNLAPSLSGSINLRRSIMGVIIVLIKSISFVLRVCHWHQHELTQSSAPASGWGRTFIYWPRRGRTDPMPEFAELMEMVARFVPAPTFTFKQKTMLHLMLSLTIPLWRPLTKDIKPERKTLPPLQTVLRFHIIT